MPLVGSGFMIMWHDIASEAEADYHLWHTREHMPERLALPGFLRGRRGVGWKLEYQRYFTLYEGDSLEAFISPEYLRSLNEPTAWTSRMAPHFRNFLRVACATLASAGPGVGGAVATFRGRLPPAMTEANFAAVVDRLIAGIMALSPVTGVHCAGARPRYSEVRTRETDLRPRTNESAFDIVVVVEGVGLTELARVAADITQLVRGTGLLDIVSQAYDMAFLLGRGAE
jgi:hypothetical protein